MSLPVEKLCAKMDGMRIPDTIYSLLIEKYFDQADCATALAGCGTLDGFAPLYYSSRNWKGFVINEQCFYFTPSSWSLFSNQHITLDCIKIFNINHVYWLPAELLLNKILKMPMLEELSIKGTQVCTVVQVARILQSCPKIQKLDFTYTEKSQEEILSGFKKANISLKSFATSFQKLTSLKLSTTVPDPFKDPWLLIIKMLSFCRDCTDLTIEITYSGERASLIDGFREKLEQVTSGQRVKEDVESDWLPQLAWMKSLKSLVMVKLGPYGTSMAGERVISILLDSLTCQYLFPHRRGSVRPRPLERIWIQNFEIHRCAALKYSSPENLKSYLSGDCDVKEEKYQSFRNLEHLGGMMGIDFCRPLSSLKKLKYATGHISREDKFHKFCEAHPQLEYLSVDYWSDSENGAVSLCKLPKLKSFSCERLISKAFVDAMTEAYPTLEILQVTTHRHQTIPPDHQAILPSFRFPNLTFLSLSNFQLLDGAALIPVIVSCPKLQIVHLETDSLDPSSFPSNLELFLGQAVNLRDFRFQWSHNEDVHTSSVFSSLKALLIGSDRKEDVYPATFFSILKALLKGSVQLERVALIDAGSGKLPDWKHPPEFADFLVDFTAKMKHLTCCCLTFNQLGVKLTKEIKQRVEKEVATERPSLWFHLDRVLPEATDPGVPAIHYHQIVHPISFFIPRF